MRKAIIALVVVVALVGCGLLLPTASSPSAPLLLEDTAKIVLVAPSTACVGELVRLDATGSTADSFKWILVPESADFEVYADGRRAIFSARRPGKVMFILAVAKGGTVDCSTYIVEITGDTPQPPNPPQPGTAVAARVAELSANLPKPEKLKLASNFDRIAGMGLADASVWIYETSKTNREILGPKVAEFEPFFKELGTFLSFLSEDGQLETPEDHIKVWKEIALGLRG